MNRFTMLVLLAMILPSAPALAGAGGTVEAMQMPAWHERDGIRKPLRPGTALASGDLISTGANARVLLRLEEGSLVKLGEDSRIDLETLRPPANTSGIFEALMRISRGAFRFTTTAFSKQRQRNIGVRVGVVFAGIRGTDIWGRSDESGDLLVLIEGSISARREGEPEFTMDQPLTAFTVPRNQPALPLETVAPDKLERLARETELQHGSGILSIDGRWAANLMSLKNHASAATLKQKLDQAGYATELQSATIGGENWRRVRITGFRTYEDARSFADRIRDNHGIEQAWIVKD